jgi:type II secretory pathway component PulF
MNGKRGFALAELLVVTTILLLGGVLACIVISLYLPIFTLGDQISGV